MGEATEGRIDERLVAVNKLLDEYEGSLGLVSVGVAEKDIEKWLKTPLNELLKMDHEQRRLASGQLYLFTLSLQRAINKERAIARWAEESINQVIAGSFAQLGGLYGAERRPAAIKMNDVATKFERLRLDAQLRIDRISFLTDKFTALADIIVGRK